MEYMYNVHKLRIVTSITKRNVIKCNQFWESFTICLWSLVKRVFISLFLILIFMRAINKTQLPMWLRIEQMWSYLCWPCTQSGRLPCAMITAMIRNATNTCIWKKPVHPSTEVVPTATSQHSKALSQEASKKRMKKNLTNHCPHINLPRIHFWNIKC